MAWKARDLMIATGLALLPTPSAAQSAPVYDIVAYCQLVTPVSNRPLPNMPEDGTYGANLGFCRQRENLAHNQLAAAWAAASPAVQSRCAGVAELGTTGSYAKLVTCLNRPEHPDKFPSLHH